MAISTEDCFILNKVSIWGMHIGRHLTLRTSLPYFTHLIYLRSEIGLAAFGIFGIFPLVNVSLSRQRLLAQLNEPWKRARSIRYGTCILTRLGQISNII